MSLLEVVQRKVRKRGMVPKLVKSLPHLSLFLILLSLAWVAVLPMAGEFRHTYISENALMPSQAYSFFRESEWNYLRGYREEIYQHDNATLVERNAMVKEWLGEIGYKTAILNYTEPLTGIEKPTLYAIYHAPKGDDTESMVMVAPWHTKEGEFNLGGAALGLSLARYFHRMSIWAKNIIVVFPEDGQDTLRNWVNAYHTSLDQTGGSILSATIMEFPSGGDSLDYIELEYAGLNGQLPNLDLVNTAIMVSDHEGFRVSIHKAPRGQLWANDYGSRLTTLLQAVFDYGTTGILPPPGSAGGNGCEAFSGWNIQTVTLRAVGKGDRDITTYGRVVEAIFRSVNNLLEKFHQSYFFYLLLGPQLFVSIGTYLPCAALTAAAFVVAAVSVLLNNANINNSSLHLSTLIIAPSSSKVLIISIGSVFSILVTSVIGSLGLSRISSQHPYNGDTDTFYHTLTYTYCIIPSTALCLLPVATSYFVKARGSRAVNDLARFLYSFSLYCFAFTLVALMLLHFSLSALVALAAFPLSFIRYGPASNKCNRFKSAFWLFVSSPFTWIFVLGLLSKTNFQIDKVRNLVQYFSYGLLQKEIQNVIDWTEEISLHDIMNGPVNVLYGLISGYWRFQNWTWFFLSISWIPAWFAALFVSCFDVRSADYGVSDEKKNE